MIDLHMHSTCSDGSDTPEELYAKIKKEGISVFALTDHDTVSGISEMVQLSADDPDMRFVPGIEISTLLYGDDPDSDSHILGLNIDFRHQAIREIIEKNIAMRKLRFEEILVWLKNRFDLELEPEEVAALRKIPNVGKAHFRNLLVAKGYATDNQECYNRYFGDYTSTLFTPSKEGIQAVLAAGGIPVWAHPLGDEPETEKHIGQEVFRQRLDTMLSYGLQGLECLYSRYTEEEERILLDAAKEKGLLVSGGSDYHGRFKNVSLGCLGRESFDCQAINVI